MRKLLAVSVAAALAIPASALAEEWEIDSAHSQVGFAVKHLMVSTVRGEFNKFNATLNYDEKDPAKAMVDVTIDVASIDTREPKRDEHLKSPDFFDAAKYPTITFKSTKVQKQGKDKMKLTGDLTIHGVTRPVVLEVQGPTKAIKNPYGKSVTAVSATTKINRKDFGVLWSAKMDNGGLVAGDEVQITIDAEFLKKEPAPEAKK